MKLRRTIFLFAFIIMTFPVEGGAQDMPFPLSPNAPQDVISKENAEYYPTYNLTPDKIKILKLSEPATSTIVGNQNHLDIFFDTSDRAALVPRKPGASFFQILNSDGKIIAEGHAIVAAPKNDYVRIRRSCAGDSGGCEDLQVYFCPDMCHDVDLADDAEASAGQTPSTSSPE